MNQDRRKNPDPPQKLIASSLAHGHTSLQTSSKSVHNFLRYFAHRHTDGHTDRYENITSSAEIIPFVSVICSSCRLALHKPTTPSTYSLFQMLLFSFFKNRFGSQCFTPLIPRSHWYCLSLPLCLERYNASITPWVHSGVTKRTQCMLHYRPSATVE